MDTESTSTTGTPLKIAVSALVVAAATVVTLHGTDATFTASASRGHSITTGTPSLVLGNTGANTNRLGIDTTGLGPGGRSYRSFDLMNQGNHDFTNSTLGTTVTTSSKLDTDATNGLQVTLERCSTPWAETGTQPAFSYTCSGTRSIVLTTRAISFGPVALTGMSSQAASGMDHLLLTEYLPTSADNTFQNQTSAVTFTFDAA